MQAMCEYGERCSVSIPQEPEPCVRFLVDDLVSAQEMRSDVSRPNFGLLVDLGHMGLERESTADLGPAADAALHAHFSDRQANQHTDQVIGTGAMPLGEMMAGLRRLQVDDLVCAPGVTTSWVSPLSWGLPATPSPTRTSECGGPSPPSRCSARRWGFADAEQEGLRSPPELTRSAACARMMQTFSGDPGGRRRQGST
jgi:hypothetical protein